MAKKSFVGGAIILMVAGFIVRMLGFVYRIYLSNAIGAEGVGLFQLISPLYSLIILTLTSGISIAVSKMVAEEYAKGHLINLRRITTCATVVVVAAGLIVSVFLYIFMDPIVTVILKDERTYWSMVLTVPCIPVIAAASAIKGYFYGIQDVVPTAVSQVVEQIVRIGLVMTMARYFLNIGLEYACALATVGTAIGEISNLAVVAAVYRYHRRKAGRLSTAGLIRKRVIVRKLILFSIPVSFNRFITSIMSSVEYLLIPRRLLASGLQYKQSIEEYGRLTGMAMPLLFFPSIVTSSLATTLVPAISEAVSLKNFRLVNYRISKSIQMSFIMGFIFSAVFLVYPHEISDIFHRRENIGGMLHSMAFTCVFLYVQQTLLGIINGLGKQGISLRHSILGSAIRIFFVYFLIPVYGVRGYIWGIAISTAVVCILNLHTVMKATGLALDIRNWILKPGIVCLFMCLAGRYVYHFFSMFGLNDRLTALLAILGDVTIGFALMVIVGALRKQDLKRLVNLRKVK